MVEVIDCQLCPAQLRDNVWQPVQARERRRRRTRQVHGLGQGNDGGAAPAQGGGMRGAGGTSLVYTTDATSDYSVLRDSAVLSATDDQDFQKTHCHDEGSEDGTGIEETLDVDEVLRYFAVNTFLVNLDSYASSLKHNYYLYEQDGIIADPAMGPQPVVRWLSGGKRSQCHQLRRRHARVRHDGQQSAHRESAGRGRVQGTLSLVSAAARGAGDQERRVRG